MTLSERNRIIRTAIARQTAANTATRAMARKVLISEGIYTPQGDLSADYGGPASKPKARRAKK
ncbi:MAG TPA: hypothetical protein PKA55_14980 [Rhodoblastus sp.]|nr:hypothetical protein [Rhodoblastus sp.]